MKRLVSLLAGVFLFSNVASAFDLPERFRNYRETRCGKTIKIGIGNTTLFKVLYYDIGCDKKIDVEEFYNYSLSSENPVRYGFDLNGNGLFEKEEYFLDSHVDGWDGKNEIPLIFLNNLRT